MGGKGPLAAGLSGLDCVGSGGTDRRRSAPPLTALPRIPQPQDPYSFSDRLSDSTDLSGPSRCRWVRCGRIGIGLGRWWVWEVIVFPWDDEAGSWVSGSAGPVLRAQGSSGEVWIFRAVREGGRVIASSACSGPVPLPLGDVRGDVCPAAAGCVVGGCV